ncbi:hypothetical protein FO519_005233 [Halicephalobus sp. NKZ332]|nr:hypothetical protein FO519_005233 [Halicephalobus sp. NKZ332]
MNAYIYKNRTYFIDLSLDIVERTYNRGLSLEEWEEQKEKLESQLKEEKIKQQEFDTRMVKINERIENAREIREFYNKAQEGLEQAIHTISSTVKNYANPFAGEQQPPGNAQNNTDSSVAREQPPKTAQDNTTYSTPEERYVNCILQETFETNDLSTIQVNGESIFVNLQIRQCARLHRVLDNQKEKYKELLEGAVQLANNQNFAGSRDVTSSYHIGILIEIIIIQTKNMSEYEEHTFFRQLLSGEGDQQNKLVTVLNQIKELVEWLQNGEATLALYNRVKEWSRNEANLKDFKKTTWPSPSARDHNWRKVINAAKSIQSDDFVEREALEKILEEFFKEPKYEIGQGNIQIVKRTVFLSELVPKIRGDLRPDSIVKIFAGDCCNIDTSVEWRGINLAIVTNKVNVWKEVKIDVSGKDQKSEKTKANSSLNINCSGESGRDGKPGESSGNITIFAKHFVNPELLTIIANGGRGQDGQDGGDGCAGKDGIGVTRKEIEKMLKNLNKNFKEFNYHKNFCPPGWMEKKVNSVDKEYVRKKFEDNHGRVMLYSYGIFSQGGFLFWNSYTYDFYLLINGTDGTRGSSGGENGVGGEGGYAGKVIVKDLDTDVNFPVKIISEQGKSGDNGEVGKSGKIGINGNHMGMTTCQSSNWYFYGDKTKQRLKLSHHYKREKKNRYNGYLKLKKKKNACFITFTTEEIDQTFRRTNATTKVTTRTEASRAVSKANVLTRNEPISEDILYKLILMLQQATGEIDQLTKCSLAEWMNIAEKQTVIKIKPSKGYESIEYYFELLSAKGLKEEEELLRKTMDKLKVIPGKFVGQITNFIINKEVTADTGYFEKVEKFLIQLENHQDYRESDRIIVTKEKDQNELLNWLKSQCETGKLFDEIFPKGDRTPNELENLTVWLHDAANNPAKKQKVSENCKLIESDEKLSHYKKGILYTLKSLSTEKNIFSKNKNYERLEMYNQTLYTIKGIHLRTTQKLAIICALETESHLLEQVNTGEGKSYIIAGIACIRCMTGCKSIDIITSSPVLARRDAENLKEIYSKMGVTVAHNCDEDLESRKKAYSANVVYGDMARFQRDYLLHTFYKKNILGNRTRETVIVDEVDNMMLDNGNNMLYLSHNVPGMNLLDSLLIFVQEQVFAPIYSGEKMAADTLKEKFDSQKIKQFVLEDIFGMFTEEDLARIAPRLSKDQLVRLHEKLIENQVVDSESYLEIYKEDQLKKIDRAWPDISENIRNIVKSCFLIIFQRNRRIELPNYLRPFVKLHLDKLIENCKTAFFMKPNTEYVIDVDRTGAISSCEPLVTIIDGNTGADLPISQWSEGLHQFLQLKHGCRISAISLKAVFISNVTYLKGYEKINGLSGTLGSTHESRTLVDLYNADLIKVPTAKPKFFCEYVPIIVIKKDEWIKSIYNEIEDQVSVGRSVLIICENIEQLHIIVLGLKNNFNAEKNLSEELKKCFETLFIYEREHDTFEFESVLLEVGRLIVATNLAGRGTDIKLSDELITNGGLHTEYENTHMKCSVFMHKIFRDNNEIIRLDKLKEYYEFHINIEEQCLEKFRAHCEQVLSAVASQTKAADFLPTLQQIQYFSLLDQWAIWLDSVNPQIEKCSKQGDAGASMEKRIEIKNRIINSTDEFIKKYPIEKNRCCPKWLATPQALLSIGVNFVRHEDGLKEADNIFDRVIKEEPGFAAEAHYYKGIIRTVNFSDTIPQKLTEYKFNKAPFLSNLEEVREHLLKSRALFLLRIQRKEQEAKIAGQLVVKDGLQVIEISGFLEQHKAIIKYLYLMVQNIDYLLGTPCEPKMFMQREITEEQSKEIYKSFVLQGIISPNLIIDSTREKWQLDAIQKKYRLSYNEIHRIFNKIKKDLMRTSYDNLLVLDQNVLSNKASLSTRGEFWAQMEYMGALDNSEVILIVNRKINEELPEFFKGIQKVDIYVEQQTPFFIRFSNSTSIEDEIYYFKDVNEIIKNNEKWNDEVNRLINCGFLKLDTIAMLNVLTLKRLGYFEKFDGVTTEDLMEYFGIEKSSAKSILHLLVEEGILEYQSFPMKKIDEKHEIWKKIKEFITYEAEEEKKMNSQLDGEEQTPNSITKKKENPLRDPFKQHCYSLFELKDNEEIINFTSSVVSRYCGISIDSEEETLFYKYLEEERIIIPYNYWIYRQVSRIDLRSLPQCISLQLDEFFSDRFAFTFALDGILHAINKSIQGEPTCLQIFLPEDPLVDFEKDLVNYGFVMDARIFTKDAECIDYEDIGNEELMRKIIETNRCKLHDQTDYHLRLKPFGAHALEEGFVLDTDMRNMIDNGMLVVLSLNTEKDAWSLTSQIFKAGMKVFNAVKSVIKVIGNFCGKVINTTGKIIQETIKTVGRAINATSAFIRETAERFFPEFVEFYDATINAVSTAGMKVLQGAEWVTRKAMQGINWVEENIVDPIQTGLITGIKWVSDKTRLTDLLKAVVAKVQYIFGKISRFCTALMESYEYYNQLRTATRRTALEQRIGINEHTILRAYHENKFEQRKKDEKLDKTNKKIEIDLIKFRTSLWTICDQLIKINPKNMDNKVSTKLVLDVFENGRSMKFFKSEFKDQLIFSAWLFQSEFYAYMDSENSNYTFKGLSPEILQHPIENFFDELNDFVSDDDNKSEAQDITENWLNVFHEQLKTLINDMIESTCIEPSSKVLYDLASNREILTFVKHNEDDETLKEAINNDVSESMNQSKILFLRKELVSLFSDRIISYADANKEFLKHAIKYGYPLPLKVMKTVADIIEIVVTESFSYGAGFKLIVNSEENKVIDYSTKPSAVKEVHLEAYNGYIYLCQRDFQENTGLTEAKDEKQLPFFYEAYVRCLKDISHKFVKKEETMRQMILEKL